MGREAHPLFPRERLRAEALGERLQLARLRRQVPLRDLAARVGVSRPTIMKLEAGDPSISLDVLIRVLQVLSLIDDLDKIAAEDQIGRRLEDLKLSRSPRLRKPIPRKS